MSFFNVEDGDGGSAADRIAIVAVMAYAFCWIPIMVVWKIISVVRRRYRSMDEGNMPVTTNNADPEKQPYRPESALAGHYKAGMPYLVEEQKHGRSKHLPHSGQANDRQNLSIIEEASRHNPSRYASRARHEAKPSSQRTRQNTSVEDGGTHRPRQTEKKRQYGSSSREQRSRHAAENHGNSTSKQARRHQSRPNESETHL